MVRSGCNIKQLQALLGHATISITMDAYAHLFDDDLPMALSEPVEDSTPDLVPAGLSLTG